MCVRVCACVFIITSFYQYNPRKSVWHSSNQFVIKLKSMKILTSSQDIQSRELSFHFHYLFFMLFVMLIHVVKKRPAVLQYTVNATLSM